MSDDVAGWRVRATFMERGWRRTKTEGFFNPDQDVCLENIKIRVELWHPNAEDIQLEVVSSIPKGKGWGDGEWTQAFKKEATP